ncbi:MAG: hypothetical protein H6Q15_2035 [Bacteroidetes bacterium]|nr:hypothetical protein [Bacteroidota bacterium]
MKDIVKLAMISTFVFLSCEKQDNMENVHKRVPLSVKAGISIEPTTKAIVSGTTFPDGTKIGVQVLKNSDGNTYETGALTNIEFTYASANTSWSSSSGFNLSNTTGKVYAYHPYASQGTNYALFNTIPATLPSEEENGNDTDYMYATPIIEADKLVSNATGKNSASLTMNHALAQISFVVYKENYPGSGSFTQFKIEDAAATNWIILSKAVDDDLIMNITSGAITGGAKGILTRNLSIPCILSTTPPSADVNVLRTQVNATALVAPTSAIGAGEIKFTFTVDGKSSTASNTSSVTWERGKQYIYKVKLSGTGLSISSVTVTDWTPSAGDDIVIN